MTSREWVHLVPDSNLLEACFNLDFSGLETSFLPDRHRSLCLGLGPVQAGFTDEAEEHRKSQATAGGVEEATGRNRSL